MFSMRNFVKDGFLKAVGKMADYQVILNAASWHEKGVLTEEDLAEIQSAISAKNAVAEDEVPGEMVGVT
ncbi:MAG: hypothetical protein IKB79_00525 [Oscillospiraceae bacterium]|nr:hypothetical protein [Oscillospiraceae bacterium]